MNYKIEVIHKEYGGFEATMHDYDGDFDWVEVAPTKEEALEALRQHYIEENEEYIQAAAESMLQATLIERRIASL